MPNQLPITIGGYQLDGSASVMASTTSHDAAPSRNLSLIKVTRRDGMVLTNTDYQNKTIRIDGALLLKNQADFEQVSDDFKRSVTVQEGFLDIPYRNDTRRYTVTTQNIGIARDSDNVEWAPYSLEFIASNPPFGYDPYQQRAYSASQIVASTFSSSVYLGGSAEPKPTLRFDISSGSKLTDIEFRLRSPNQSRIQFSNSVFATGDIYQVDTNRLSVYQNGLTSMDYVGQFPTFTPNAWNSFDVNFISAQGGVTLDQQQISYRKQAAR